MQTKFILKYISLLSVTLALFTGCTKDPYDGVVSNEKSIEAVTLGAGFIQIGPATVDRAAKTVSVKVLMEANTSLSAVKPLVQASYNAKTVPASGETVNFTASNNKVVYKVTSESGETNDWTIELVPFSETIVGSYKITFLTVYGGTGPEYGGGEVIKLADKPWLWPVDGSGPQAETDNTLVFELTGATPEGYTYGKFVNNAGTDGKYADFLFSGTPAADVNSLYRTMPKGEGVWTRDYANNFVTFKFADGSIKVATFRDGGYTFSDYSNQKVVAASDKSFEFNLNGSDDWNSFGSDRNKVVLKPRKFWIDVKKTN